MNAGVVDHRDVQVVRSLVQLVESRREETSWNQDDHHSSPRWVVSRCCVATRGCDRLSRVVAPSGEESFLMVFANHETVCSGHKKVSGCCFEVGMGWFESFSMLAVLWSSPVVSAWERDSQQN